MSVMSLPDEHGGHTVPPNAFDCGQDMQFVVEHYIMLCRVPRDYIGEFLLFVHIDEDSTLNGFAQASLFDFVRLKHDIAVTKQGGFSPALDVPYGGKGFRKHAIFEGVIEEKTGDLQQMKVVRVIAPIALERTEVIGIA